MERSTRLFLLFASLLTGTYANVLTIYGFVPGNNEIYSALYHVPAACMALDDINNSSLLQNYSLQLIVAAPECDMSEGVLGLIEAVITRNPTREQLPVMFLDGGCSEVTESLAALTGQLYNATMVSFGSLSPSLFDQDRFPKFFRTVPSEIQVNSLRLAIMNMFNWTRVATLHQTDDAFSVSSDDFSASYNLMFQNVTTSNKDDVLLISRSFTDNPSIPLQQMKDDDVRIIFAWMHEDKAVKVFCEAIRLGLTTKNHVWIIPAWYTQDWWKKTATVTNGNCTTEELEEALDFALAVDVYSYSLEPNLPGVSGHDANLFVKNYCRYQTAFMDLVARNLTSTPFSCLDLKPNQAANNCSMNKHSYTPFTYDAMWSMALGLKRAEDNLTSNFTMSLANFSYSNTYVTDAIFDAMKLTNFRGVSGNLSFDSTGTRNGLNALYQIRRVKSNGLCLKIIAVHDPLRENYTFQNSTDITWKGGSVPYDRVLVKPVYLSSKLVTTFNSFTTICIAVLLAILVFNTAAIRKPLIADSAPHINAIAIIGCLLLLISCYLLGVDSHNPPSASSEYLNQRYSKICMFRLWFLTIGFTISFGSLFGKTWQAHRVYVDSKLQYKPFKMWNFLIILTVLLMIDVAYLSIWTVLWPLQHGTDVQDFGDIQLRYEFCTCDKFSYLIGALFVFKGLIVLCGLFLAYETRNVNYKHINDTKYVSIATYVVAIMVGVGSPMSLVLTQNLFINVAYGLAASMIISACLSCILIIQIPKVVYVAMGKDTMPVTGTNNEDKVVTANELQMGWIDPKQERGEVCTSVQNHQGTKGDDEAKTSSSLNSEADSGVNMNIDDTTKDIAVEDGKEGPHAAHSCETVIHFSE